MTAYEEIIEGLIEAAEAWGLTRGDVCFNSRVAAAIKWSSAKMIARDAAEALDAQGGQDSE